MAGIIRNIITLIVALIGRKHIDTQSTSTCYFHITPFDCGINVLKSDKYFQLAECAQIDFLVKANLMSKLRTERIHFVNASQLVKFVKPIGMFKRVRVETKVIHTDSKCAYFSHVFFLGDQKKSEVLVKMKFKQGSLTIDPEEILGKIDSESQAHLHLWDQTLEAMSK